MTIHGWLRVGRRTGRALLAVGLAALVSPVAVAAPAERLCIPRVGSSAPVVGDGTLDEPGWTGSLRRVFSNGTPRPHGAIQAITDGTTLFLALEAYHAHGSGGLDAVVLGFQVGGGPARALTVRLSAAATPAGPLLASQRRRAEATLLVAPGPGGSGGPWTETGDPGWPVAAASGGAGGGWWFVEAAVPLADLGLPARGPFALYAAILRGAGQGDVVELAWPPGALVSGSLRGLPDPATWGVATLDPAGCLDRPAADTDLAAASLRNMRLGVAERSSARFLISADGPVPAGAGEQVTVQSLREGYFDRAEGIPPRYRRDAPVTGPLWIIHGYLHTGQWIEVSGAKCQLLTPIDSFGYTVAHEGATAEWPSELTTRIEGVLITEGDGVYKTEIPPNGKVVLHTTIEAVEPAGPAVPPPGCGCRRLPGGAVGLAFFGLLAFAPRARDRRAP
jgi:hypothetical protein